jgi:hypothetical protein
MILVVSGLSGEPTAGQQQPAAPFSSSGGTAQTLDPYLISVESTTTACKEAAVKLGVSKPVAATISRGFGFLVLALAFVAGWKTKGASRWTEAVVALGLLGLGSLTSNGAWGDYVPTTAIWLLVLVAAPVRMRARWAIPVAAIAVFQYFLIGTMPVGNWFEPRILIPASAVGVIGLLVLFGGAVLAAWDDRLRTADALAGRSPG